MGVPQKGWFISEHPIKMDDLGVPPFSETTILSHMFHDVLSTGPEKNASFKSCCELRSVDGRLGYSAKAKGPPTVAQGLVFLLNFLELRMK